MRIWLTMWGTANCSLKSVIKCWCSTVSLMVSLAVSLTKLSGEVVITLKREGSGNRVISFVCCGSGLTCVSCGALGLPKKTKKQKTTDQTWDNISDWFWSHTCCTLYFIVHHKNQDHLECIYKQSLIKFTLWSLSIRNKSLLWGQGFKAVQDYQLRAFLNTAEYAYYWTVLHVFCSLVLMLNCW